MSTSRRIRNERKTRKLSFRRLLRLQSALSLLFAFIIYTALSEYIFTPIVVEVREEEGSYAFLSTDLHDTVRPSLEHSIRSAKQSVLLIIYSLSDKKIVAALKEAANRGLSVVVIHDPVETPDCGFLLGKAVTCYPRRAKGLMHTKLLVVDHSEVWLGSANMSTRSLTEQGNLIVALRSKAIAQAIEHVSSSMISQSEYKEPPLHVEFPESKLTLFFHPYHGDLAFRSLISRINKASKRVFVAMFTFTHPELVSALCRAKQRGVDVRVLFDQESAQQTSRNSYLRFKREKIPCGYRTKQGLLHYKTAIIDSTLVAGSCNWTKAGFSNNHEAMLFIDPICPSQQPYLDRWWKEVEQYSTLAR